MPCCQVRADAYDFWVKGVTDAYEAEHQRDSFTMSEHEFQQLVSITISPDVVCDFVKRYEVMRTCFDQAATRKLPQDQAVRLMESCVSMAKRVAAEKLGQWRAKADAVHTACQELLAEKPKRRRSRRAGRRKPVEECIVCMDGPRDHVYKPCGHRVSCGECAQALRERSTLCPWCRQVVD